MGAGVDAIGGMTDITSAGSLTLAGGHDFTTVGAFTNDGALTVGGGTSFIVPAGDSFVSSGVTIVNGSLTSDTITVVSGRLGGSGTITGPITAQTSATVAPGNSPGILSTTGDFELQAGSTLQIEIGGPDVGSDYDQVNVTGGVNTCRQP